MTRGQPSRARAPRRFRAMRGIIRPRVRRRAGGRGFRRARGRSLRAQSGYDGSINAPGVAGIELHANTIVSGDRTAPRPSCRRTTRATSRSSPPWDLTPWWEVGAYLQTSLQGDGGYRFAGVKLRSKFSVPSPPSERLRVGVNVEISRLPEAYDASRWGAEMRPTSRCGRRARGKITLAFNRSWTSALAGPTGHPPSNRR
jgi:hypothetical protein